MRWTCFRQSWPLGTARRTGIHDLAPAPDGGVWFTAQASGHLGWFDPKAGRTELIPLGSGSSPHGVIQGPDKGAWITDSGQNAIVRVGWPDRKVQVLALPQGTPYANLNTAAFDGDGDLWFTGQAGYIGKVAVKTGEVEPATRNQGARRVWSDSKGRIWVSEWNSGNLSVHDPGARTWAQWKLPGDSAKPYAVYVDERDIVWVSDFGGNAMFAFDPRTQKFERFGFPRDGANVRQILGRPGEVWLPESGTEHITVIRTT